MGDFGTATVRTVRTVDPAKLASLAHVGRPPSLPGELDRLLPYPLTVCVWGCETKSEANTREHHMARYRRFKAQATQLNRTFADAGVFALLAAVGGEVRDHGGKIAVTFTRVGKRKLDSDNLAGAFKAVRDELADMVMVDDGHPGIDWRYPHDRQQVGSPAVVITLEAL